MKLSQASQSALVGTAYLAEQPSGTVLQVGQVATATGLAQPFLAKIFGRLARSGILRSHRGRERGFSLARPPAKIAVREIVEAIEGSDAFDRCVFWSNRCSDTDPCVLHEMWRPVRPMIEDLMTRTTVEDLVERPSTAGDVAALLARATGEASLPTRPTRA